MDIDDTETFKKIWFEEFGEVIDNARAEKEIKRLLTIVKFSIEALPEGRTAGTERENNNNKKNNHAANKAKKKN